MLVERERRATGQQVAQRVEHRDGDGGVAVVLERRGAHPAGGVTARPARAEDEPARRVAFLERKLVADGALVEGAFGRGVGHVVDGEGLPQHRLAAAARDAHERERAGVVVAVVQPVHGLVGQ